jgi:hypothetical protein
MPRAPKEAGIDKSNPPVDGHTVDQLKEYIEKTSSGLVGRMEIILKGLNKPQWKKLADDIHYEKGAVFSDSRAKGSLLDAGAKEKPPPKEKAGAKDSAQSEFQQPPPPSPKTWDSYGYGSQPPPPPSPKTWDSHGYGSQPPPPSVAGRLVDSAGETVARSPRLQPFGVSTPSATESPKGQPSPRGAAGAYAYASGYGPPSPSSPRGDAYASVSDLTPAAVLYGRQLPPHPSTSRGGPMRHQRPSTPRQSYYPPPPLLSPPRDATMSRRRVAAAPLSQQVPIPAAAAPPPQQVPIPATVATHSASGLPAVAAPPVAPLSATSSQGSGSWESADGSMSVDSGSLPAPLTPRTAFTMATTSRQQKEAEQKREDDKKFDRYIVSLRTHLHTKYKKRGLSKTNLEKLIESKVKQAQAEREEEEALEEAKAVEAAILQRLNEEAAAAAATAAAAVACQEGACANMRGQLLATIPQMSISLDQIPLTVGVVRANETFARFANEAAFVAARDNQNALYAYELFIGQIKQYINERLFDTRFLEQVAPRGAELQERIYNYLAARGITTHPIQTDDFKTNHLRLYLATMIVVYNGSVEEAFTAWRAQTDINFPPSQGGGRKNKRSKNKKRNQKRSKKRSKKSKK